MNLYSSVAHSYCGKTTIAPLYVAAYSIAHIHTHTHTHTCTHTIHAHTHTTHTHPHTHTHTHPPQIYRMVSRLQEKCGSEQASRAQLQQKILGIIFSGVLQLILSSIEDARRSRTLVNVPKFSAFIKYLSAGSGVCMCVCVCVCVCVSVCLSVSVYVKTNIHVPVYCQCDLVLWHLIYMYPSLWSVELT